MRRHHDRATLRPELLEQPDDRLGLDVVEVRRRLVGEQQRRIVSEAAGDGDSLLLTARQLRRPMVGPIGQPDDLEQFVGARVRPPSGRDR